MTKGLVKCNLLVNLQPLSPSLSILLFNLSPSSTWNERSCISSHRQKITFAIATCSGHMSCSTWVKNSTVAFFFYFKLRINLLETKSTSHCRLVYHSPWTPRTQATRTRIHKEERGWERGRGERGNFCSFLKLQVLHFHSLLSVASVTSFRFTQWAGWLVLALGPESASTFDAWR